MSPIYGQLSDKRRLAFVNQYGVLEAKHNSDRVIKRRAASCRPARLRPSCRFYACRLNFTRNVRSWPLAETEIAPKNVRFRGADSTDQRNTF